MAVYSTDLTKALRAARNQALLQGRPLSPQETAGISGGWFQQAGERMLGQQELALADDRLAFQRWAEMKKMKAGKKLSKNELLQNLFGSGATLGMLMYDK